MRSLSSLLPLIVLAVLFYLLLIRPQRNRQRQAQSLVSKVAPGDQVMMSSGIFGTVAEVADDAVYLEVAPEVEIRFLKAAIQRIVTPAGEVVALDEHDVLDEDAGTPVVAPPTGNPAEQPDGPLIRPAGATRADGDLPVERR